MLDILAMQGLVIERALMSPLMPSVVRQGRGRQTEARIERDHVQTDSENGEGEGERG